MENIEKKLNELKIDSASVDVTENVMNKIEGNTVKMHSVWYFRSQKSLLSSGFVLLLIVIAFLINLSLYDIRESYALEYAEFGAQGIGIMLSNLPYLLILFVLVLFGIAIWLMTRFEISYKKTFAVFIVVLVVGTSMGGTAIFASDFNEQVQKKIDNDEIKMPVVSPVARTIYKKYGPRMVKDGLVGRITQLPDSDSNEFIITIPQGKQIHVKLMPNSKIIPAGRKLASGDLIIIIGKPIVNYHAKGIKIIENEKKALEMVHKLKTRQFQMKFRQRMPFDENDMKQFQAFPINDEMRREFMGNMGGYLQSEQQLRQANIIFGQ